MSIDRLTLTDFRNHVSAMVEPGANFVLLSGPNGAGKTNILEAVSMLVPGRGLRGVGLGEMARSAGPGGWAVAAGLLPPLPLAGGDRGVGTAPGEGADVDRPTPSPSRLREGGITLGTGTLATAPDRRVTRINSAPAPVTALAERIAVTWLTPAMDRLFTESAGGRRRFLDRLTLALEPGHAGHAARYEAAMRARNKLLADPDSADPAWLTALEAGMAEHGQALADARKRTVMALAEVIAASPDGDFPRAELQLGGWSGDELARQLKSNRGRDAAAGRATEGPHRQDLAVTHLAKQQSAARGSTGEQKALLIGLVLAHADLVAARRGSPPVLLLDEVAAHLDPGRRAALFERLSGKGQVWLTATEPELFSGIAGATRFHVEQGAVSAG